MKTILRIAWPMICSEEREGSSPSACLFRSSINLRKSTSERFDLDKTRNQAWKYCQKLPIHKVSLASGTSRFPLCHKLLQNCQCKKWKRMQTCSRLDKCQSVSQGWAQEHWNCAKNLWKITLNSSTKLHLLVKIIVSTKNNCWNWVGQNELLQDVSSGCQHLVVRQGGIKLCSILLSVHSYYYIYYYIYYILYIISES